MILHLPFLKPVESFIYNDATGVTFRFSYWSAVPDKIVRVFMIWGCIVFRKEPVIKAVLVGCWFIFMLSIWQP